MHVNTLMIDSTSLRKGNRGGGGVLVIHDFVYRLIFGNLTTAKNTTLKSVVCSFEPHSVLLTGSSILDYYQI
jgi:hypothetical protein